jgi:hypothetical protein
MTDKSIWGGLGNLRFLQVNCSWLGMPRFLKNIWPNLFGRGDFPENNLKISYSHTNGLTEKLIWGGLGNLRFLQVKELLLSVNLCNEYFSKFINRVRKKEKDDEWAPYWVAS